MLTIKEVEKEIILPFSLLITHPAQEFTKIWDG